MQQMRFSTGTALVIALFASLGNVLPAFADDAESLRRAAVLFEQGEYLAAQELLVGIDRESLEPQQQQQRDDLLKQTQVAANMYEKAMRDLEDAETATAEGELDRAQQLIEAVLDNAYAPEPVQQSAQNMLNEIAGGGEPTIDQPTDDGEPPVQATERTTPVGPSPADAQRARTLSGEAEEIMQAGRYDAARRLFEEAMALVPGYPDAADGLASVREHERNVAGSRSQELIDQIRREDQINWQRTVAEYREAEKTVRNRVAAERFEQAGQMLIRARQVVESGKQFASPVARYEELRNELDTLANEVRTQERLHNERKVLEIRQQIEQDRASRLDADARNRTRQVDMLMRQAMQHRKDGDLDAAITVLKQVTIIDPRDRTARWMLDELVDLRDYRRSREIRQTFYKESRRALQDVEEAKIPWHQELIYPDNWAEMISRPERSGPGGSARNSRLISALDRRISVDFRGLPFDEVIERLADTHRVNVIINWNDLKRAGVERTVPIELSLPNEITLKKAITEVLEQAGGGLIDVGYDIADGVVKIATRHTLDKNTYTAVYDIKDLLMEIPNFNDAPMTDLAQVNREARAAVVERADRPWMYGDDDDDENEVDVQLRGRVRRIIDLIEDTVAPDSWTDRGGSIGTISELNGQLVITQNSASQRHVANLLGKLREQRAIQIAVESRFITVSSHYLEELGIDLDIVLNSGNAGFDYIPGAGGPVTDPVLGSALLLPRSFSRLGFTPNVPGLGSANTLTGANVAQPYNLPFLVPQGRRSGNRGTPIPIRSSLTGFTDPSNLGSDVPGSFAGTPLGPALSIFGSFLDNIQVDFLLRATQADSRTSVLTAPRLVLFNGQRSWVAVTIQQNFVSQLNPVVATGAVAQAPQVGTIDSGAVLDVAATVTADRRYVTMTLRPGVTRLLDLQTIPFSGGGAGGAFGGGTALAAFIQLPTLSSQRVQTTVSIPDGGTLLIGGQKLASETEVEAGVPILSKIPILKRAYSSRSLIKDEQTLLILIKPKILIQSEQEELAFPSFGRG